MTCSIDVLKKRADLYQYFRSFFGDRDVLEVDVPVLGKNTVTDVFIEPLTSQIFGREYFLQTSPEYYMKRLLADGVGSIFYLGKAFREDENSKRHRPEFTMLEWYRLGLDDFELIAEMRELFQGLSPKTAIFVVSYSDLFQSYFDTCPHRANKEELHLLSIQHTSFVGSLESKGAYLDLLFSYCLEPSMEQGITFVYDYPVVQSALARVKNNDEGLPVARRFEVFWDGLELANGYWELVDTNEQRRRFLADIALRKKMGLSIPRQDLNLISALDKGLPECAGVALGVDRLLMCILGLEEISEVLSFPDG